MGKSGLVELTIVQIAVRDDDSPVLVMRGNVFVSHNRKAMRRVRAIYFYPSTGNVAFIVIDQRSQISFYPMKALVRWINKKMALRWDAVARQAHSL